MTTRYGRENGRASSKATDTTVAARRYIRQGLSIIPVPKAKKNPARDGWQNERHTLEDVDRLWGNDEGIGCLWGLASHSFCDVDLDCREASIAADEIMPRTRTFGRPDAPKSHRIVRVTDEVPATRKFVVSADEAQGQGRMICELLSTGAQSLLPPSWHHSGQRRQWYSEGKSARMTSYELVDAVTDIASAALIARNWPGEGARHAYSLAAAGFLFRHLPPERAERIMLAAIAASGDEESDKRIKNIETTRERLDNGSNTTGGATLESLAGGVVKRLRSWHGWGKKQPQKEPDPDQNGDAPTHDQLRDRFIERHPQLAHGLGVWRAYGNGIWPSIEDYQVEDDVCLVLEDAKPEKIRPTYGLVRSVADLTRVRISKPDQIWDRDPDVLVCRNGTLRLSTGELEPHSRHYYATASVGYDFDENADSEVWQQRILGELIAENLGLEAVGFLQEFCGLCLTSDQSHEVALWFHGRHGGGRSTILAGLEAMLGPKAGPLSLRDIERSSFALTNLPGKTLVTSAEQPGMFLRGGGVLNSIISGEPVQIDIKFRDPITIVPRAKIVWALNELPRIGNADDGLFRRVKVLPIPEIPESERDPQVKERVKESGAGILVWALEGLERLRKRGHFVVPKTIRTATQKFRDQNDVAGMFVAERCEVNADVWEGSNALYQAYKS